MRMMMILTSSSITAQWYLKPIWMLHKALILQECAAIFWEIVHIFTIWSDFPKCQTEKINTQISNGRSESYFLKGNEDFGSIFALVSLSASNSVLASPFHLSLFFCGRLSLPLALTFLWRFSSKCSMNIHSFFCSFPGLRSHFLSRRFKPLTACHRSALLEESHLHVCVRVRVCVSDCLWEM